MAPPTLAPPCTMLTCPSSRRDPLPLRVSVVLIAQGAALLGALHLQACHTVPACVCNYAQHWPCTPAYADVFFTPSLSLCAASTQDPEPLDSLYHAVQRIRDGKDRTGSNRAGDMNGDLSKLHTLLDLPSQWEVKLDLLRWTDVAGTLFAPSDAAFDTFLSEVGGEDVRVEDLDALVIRAVLSDLLKLHVVPDFDIPSNVFPGIGTAEYISAFNTR